MRIRDIRPFCMLTGLLLAVVARGAEPQVEVLFDGSDLAAWQYDEGSWVIDADGALTCNMQQVKARSGQTVQRGMGDIWSKRPYGDFALTVTYRLSKGANSGVFFRADPDNPVQGGFEVQLMDNREFQKTHGPKDNRKWNGALYDAVPPSSDPSKPAGQWNTLQLTCRGPQIQIAVNGVQVAEANIDQWDTAGKNPDGTANKFKTALKELPRTGHIGLQNHGQQVWFQRIEVRPL